ncbi:MAG TPA: ParB/RepB/Spo0J family partition protein [Halanaerobiales bacterium]|nr:ParB/RepB/Spo0J family partition protein [Halanaerobiales bacterium]
MSKKRLGKGLSALIADNNKEQGADQKITKIDVKKIEPNPFQPRKKFDTDSLNELSQSIKENGIIQPITVRQVKADLYQIVSGERRWRAFKSISTKKIPAIVKDYSDKQMMEIALVENLQREDLNPMEEAQAYNKMIDNFDMKQNEIAEKVGKSRSSVANTLRLLNLPPKIQVYVSRGTISMGHARALLSLKEEKKQIEVADMLIEKDFSVRKTEEYISKIKKSKEKKKKNSSKTKEKLDEKWEKARELLSKTLGTKIKIAKRKKKKVITIECDDYKDMEKLIEKIQ